MVSTVFQHLGDFKRNNGFVYIRTPFGARDAPATEAMFTLTFSRPCILYGIHFNTESNPEVNTLWVQQDEWKKDNSELHVPTVNGGTCGCVIMKKVIEPTVTLKGCNGIGPMLLFAKPDMTVEDFTVKKVRKNIFIIFLSSLSLFCQIGRAP